MKIAIFTSHILLASHYETELEIILNHQEKGDTVTQLVCNKDLPSCDNNPYHHAEACERCVSKRFNGYKILKKRPILKSFLNLKDADKKRISEIPTKFNTVEELQGLWVDNYDIGYSIASSLISISRNPKPELEQRLLERYIISCAGVYFSVINYLKENPTDILYTFNGRLSHTKAVLRACNKMNVTCLLHERGNSLGYYSLFENTSIHDLLNTHQLVEKSWIEADPEERVKTASQWFQTRIGGKMQNWFSFLKNQVFELPPDWDAKKRNIIICNSSEDELASLGDEWKNPLYDNQLEGISRIIEDGKALPNTHFYLRIHPHLAKVDNADSRALHAMKAPHLTVLPASSLISTYHLVQKADKVLTFGSTIGIEATFMRRPSITAGKSFYYYLDATYTPKTHAELMNLISSDLQPKEIEGALKFAYFFGTFGMPFRHYKPEDFDKGSIRGEIIKPTKGLRYKLITALYSNKLFPVIGERLFYRNRDKALQKYLPE
ncbi:MAG: hypothetical protein WED33_11360 [Bacteroidia bacterium]